MPFKPVPIAITVLLGVQLMAFSAPALAAADQEVRGVPSQLLVGGDDGLTQRFAATLRKAIIASSTFVMPASDSKNPFVFLIPSNIYWQHSQGRINFQYVVIFTDKASRYFGVSVGPCWDNEMEDCANSVVRDAKLALAKRRPN